MSFTLRLVNPEPKLERADYFAIAGDYRSAFDEYQELVAVHPNDPTLHFEFGAFCHVNASHLQEKLGMDAARITQLVQSEIYEARCLKRDDLDLAYRYAFILMDEALMKSGVTYEQASEAWEYVLGLIEERRAREPEWYSYSVKAAQIHVHLARVASRFDDRDKAHVYLSKAQALSPLIRVPDQFIERNAGILNDSEINVDGNSE